MNFQYIPGASAKLGFYIMGLYFSNPWHRNVAIVLENGRWF
jgi:hypothetical protein